MSDTKTYVTTFKSRFDELVNEIYRDLEKLDDGRKNNWAATRRIRIGMRKLHNEVYTEFRDASQADEAAFRASEAEE